jgi:hypothetical protein
MAEDARHCETLTTVMQPGSTPACFKLGVFGEFTLKEDQ